MPELCWNNVKISFCHSEDTILKYMNQETENRKINDRFESESNLPAGSVR